MGIIPLSDPCVWCWPIPGDKKSSERSLRFRGPTQTYSECRHPSAGGPEWGTEAWGSVCYWAWLLCHFPLHVFSKLTESSLCGEKPDRLYGCHAVMYTYHMEKNRIASPGKGWSQHHAPQRLQHSSHLVLVVGSSVNKMTGDSPVSQSALAWPVLRKDLYRRSQTLLGRQMLSDDLLGLEQENIVNLIWGWGHLVLARVLFD